MSSYTLPPKPEHWPATDEKPWARPLLRVLLGLVCSYHVIGRENIPDPPCLIISNHMTYFDVPVMLIPAPKGLIGLAAQKYRHKPMGRLFSMYGLIWVDQFTPDLSALRDALTVLKAGYPLAIAPEGTRSHTKSLIQGRAGPAFLATRANVPVVPAAVWGTEKILRHPRPAVYARFGKPFRLPEGRAKAADLDAYTERMMCAIAALLPEQYHGVYAGNPLIAEMRALVT